MNKRKLPQWLLDAVANGNSKHTKNDEKENHGTVKLVPLSNLMSPSRGGQNSNSRNKPFSEDNLRTADISSSDKVQSRQQISNHLDRVEPVVAETELIDDDVPTSYTTAETQPSDQLLIIPGTVQPVVKTELNDDDVPTSYTTAETQPLTVVVKEELKKEIKEEPITSGAPSSSTTQSANSNTNAALGQNVKTEVTSSMRRSCNYGAKCFRRNPAHRTEFAHPGDVDYRRPIFPDAQPGTPACPWGASCYRRNPQHFIQLSHPPATTTAPVRPNIIPPTNTTSRNRRPVISVNIEEDDDDDEYDLEDPFLDDGSSEEYVPDEEESSEDEEETPTRTDS